jgi:hypothetical protein
MKLLLPAVTLATIVAGPAFADCTSPAGVGGALVWNTDYSVVQVCNGTNWVALGGNGNNGAGEVDPQVGAITDGKWCNASGGVVTCASDAPLASVALDDVTDVTITSAASGNVLHYNGSGWVNTPIASLVTASGDRIVSNTSGITVQTGGVISITTNGSTANYWDTAGRLITPGISATANLTSVTTLYASGNVGVGTTSPQAKVDVSGNVRATSSAADCTSGSLGAMRFNPVTKRPEICRMPDS